MNPDIHPHAPMRTCTGCRAVIRQADLVRVAVDGGRLVIDARRRLPGRGAYVHRAAACVTAPGLARSLKRQVTPADVSRLVSQMSPTDDNSSTSRDLPGKNGPGFNARETVEIPPAADAAGKRTTGA